MGAARGQAPVKLAAGCPSLPWHCTTIPPTLPVIFRMFLPRMLAGEGMLGGTHARVGGHRKRKTAAREVSLVTAAARRRSRRSGRRARRPHSVEGGRGGDESLGASAVRWGWGGVGMIPFKWRWGMVKNIRGGGADAEKSAASADLEGSLKQNRGWAGVRRAGGCKVRSDKNLRRAAAPGAVLLYALRELWTVMTGRKSDAAFGAQPWRAAGRCCCCCCCCAYAVAACGSAAAAPAAPAGCGLGRVSTRWRSGRGGLGGHQAAVRERFVGGVVVGGGVITSATKRGRRGQVHNGLHVPPCTASLPQQRRPQAPCRSNDGPPAARGKRSPPYTLSTRLVVGQNLAWRTHGMG